MRQPDLERAAFDAGEHARERAGGEPLDGLQPRARLAAESFHAQGRTEPFPGSNAGLWWNGTRLRKSFSACQWMSAVTWSGISG